MTANTSTEAEVAKAKGVSALAGVITDLGFTAGFAWVGGVALNVGFGVSVPFAAAWLLLLTGLWLGQIVVGQLAKVWHRERVQADITLIAASMAAQESVRGQQVTGLENFLAKLGEDDAKDDGAYL